MKHKIRVFILLVFTLKAVLPELSRATEMKVLWKDPEKKRALVWSKGQLYKVTKGGGAEPYVDFPVKFATNLFFVSEAGVLSIIGSKAIIREGEFPKSSSMTLRQGMRPSDFMVNKITDDGLIIYGFQSREFLASVTPSKTTIADLTHPLLYEEFISPLDIAGRYFSISDGTLPEGVFHVYWSNPKKPLHLFRATDQRGAVKFTSEGQITPPGGASSYLFDPFHPPLSGTTICISALSSANPR